MNPKIIRNETDYQTALQRIDELMETDPQTTSPEGEELELLAHLVEMYEEKQFPMDLPDPISAIKFRMEQQNLKAKDLVPYIGNPAKVSEVLSGKIGLSKTMIRNLVTGLKIPAEVLLQEPGAQLPSTDILDLGRNFPLAEMRKRGYFSDFQGTLAEVKSQREDLLGKFVGKLDPKSLLPSLNRQNIRVGGKHDEHALTAWRIRVANLALRESLPPYKKGTVTETFLQNLVLSSYYGNGVLLAKEYLNKNGIHLICERHLPKTHLDGAAIKLPDGSPLVALTLRFDRLDHFWFTLFHELAHIALHLDRDGIEAYFDDLNTVGKKDAWEDEANQLARTTLIPANEWKNAQLTYKSSSSDIISFANKLRISPAIVAGRVRFEAGKYTNFKQLVGSGKVRTAFGIQND